MSDNILNYNLPELQSLLENEGYEKYRASQIFEWIYKKKINKFTNMSNLPKEMISFLCNRFKIIDSNIVASLKSKENETIKYIVKLNDGEKIEMVLMEEEGGRKTLCISSQVGCSLRCKFCATAKIGFKRNLSTAEIISQLLLVTNEGNKIDNIVFMGMGEPLVNYRNVIKSIRILNDKKGMNFSPRRVTISTVGLPKRILKLASEGLELTLAVSLNSPFQEKRQRIMPIAKKIPLDEVISSVKKYQQLTNNRITFEYVLIKGVNMNMRSAFAIQKLAREIKFNLNIIPFNPHKYSRFVAPTKEDISRFMHYFKGSHLDIIQRFRRGSDISAACGQLALLR